jgi:hypothetical protein
LIELYEEELARLGKPIPPRPLAKGPLFLHVTRDPDRAWHLVGPHVLYTSNSNAEWAKERGVGATPYPPARSVDDLKGHARFAVVTPDECVEMALRLGPRSELSIQPIMGGLDPAIAWESLALFESEVHPRLVAAGLVEAR